MTTQICRLYMGQLCVREAAKRCAGCGERKPHGDFHKDRRKPAGLRSRCKPCVNAYQLAHQRAHKAKTGQYASRGYLYDHTCVVCEKTWQSNDSRLRQYCSRGCANSTRNYEITCGECGVIWYAKVTSARWCSPACERASRFSKELQPWRPQPWWARRRSLAPSKPRRWYGGRCKRCDTAFVSDQPEARYCTPLCARSDAKVRRRARKKGAYVADVSRTLIFERDRWTCQLCHRKVKRDAATPHPMAPVIDHIIPLAKGGTHEPANAQGAHSLCNSVKGDRGGGEQLMLIG